jgi:hypothetical protein
MSRAFARISLSLLLLSILLIVLGAYPFAAAQSQSRIFLETGKTVQGRFLTYWDSHGGLPQQGYPISNELQERSDTDGKTYTVQYFERAVFEYHPENQPPNDVLLSLLGVFLYNQKYPSGASNQQPNISAGSQLFSETGRRVGGRFLEYWQIHGGLSQQGLPISDEFTERSDLDGKEYRVQYFERAVFEMHPENQPPYNVLLSQLGTFRYRALYPAGPAPVIPTPVAGCTSNLAPGTWSGPFEWSFTLTADNGLAGNGSLRANLVLDVECDSTFTGTATTQSYTAQATYAGVKALTCSMTKPPVADFTGRVVAAPDGLHLAIPGGRWREGILVCSGPFSAPYTINLAGQPIDAADVMVETVAEGKIGGSKWLADPALKAIRDQIALLMPNVNVDIISQGRWELSYHPVNTP